MAPLMLLLPVDGPPMVFEMDGPPPEIRFAGPTETALIWMGRVRDQDVLLSLTFDKETKLPRNPHVPSLAGSAWVMSLAEHRRGAPLRVCDFNEHLSSASVMVALGIWDTQEDSRQKINQMLENHRRRTQQFRAVLDALPRRD